ncbi:MAG: matrixin family metalloprotease [Bdellovibrionaceae bacterium]|nr:matrixin family metalloprotease [Pseudobdellovibrionaceae bacterium]
MKLSLLSATLLFAGSVNAGGWTSGGGELIRDGHNPWFLNNTKVVNYCIQIDEIKFGQNLAFVRSRVEKSIDFWKRQLTELDYLSPVKDFSFQQGTQEFREVPCSDQVDLTFQFASLAPSQKERLGDISKMAAVTIRTDYDLVNLKGKGFIYFQANADLPFNPWSRSEGSRLFPILIHELGHVFGLQHMKAIRFMKEDFAESIIDIKEDGIDAWLANLDTKDYYQKIHLFSFAPSEFKPKGSCVAIQNTQIKSGPGMPKPLDSNFKKFFGSDPNDECFSMAYKNEELHVFSGSKTFDLIGKAALTKNANTIIDRVARSMTAIDFWMPKEQKVFTTSWVGRMGVARFVPSQIFKGTYKTNNGSISRPLSVEIDNSGYDLQVAGAMDDVVYVNIMSGF